MERKIEKKKRPMTKIIISVISFAVSSLSVLLIMLRSVDESIKIPLISTLFWSGAICGLVFCLLLGKERKKNGYKANKYPGIICFFKNKASIICDLIWFVCIITLIILSSAVGSHKPVTIIFLSLTLFCGFLHSVLNGNNYAYAKRKEQ